LGISYNKLLLRFVLWSLYSFSGEIMEYGGHDDMDYAGGSERCAYGMSVGNAQELSEENHPPIAISEDSVFYREDCSTDYSSSSLFSSSSLTHGHDQSLDKSGQLLDKPDQRFKISPESNDSKSQFALHKERVQDSKDRSLSRDMTIQSVQTVFQEWCTHSTLEYLNLSPKNDTQSVFPEATDPDSFTRRVTRFYQPTIAVKEDSDSDLETGTSPGIVREDIVIKEKKNLKRDPVCIVPPIDSKSQTTIRRRIVLDKLFRTMPDLLSEVKLTVGEISRDLTELVHTFSLSSKNVTLKPFQWKILALAFILILERKNSHVSQALESCKQNWNTLLARLEITRKDIDQVLTPLSTLQAQHPGPCKSGTSDDEAFKTSESSKEKSVVFNNRNDYGDMEELD